VNVDAADEFGDGSWALVMSWATAEEHPHPIPHPVHEGNIGQPTKVK